jgi:hypothetical protein
LGLEPEAYGAQYEMKTKAKHSPPFSTFTSHHHTQASAVGSWPVSAGATSALDAPAVPSMFTGSDIRARFDSYPVRAPVFRLAWLGLAWLGLA